MKSATIEPSDRFSGLGAIANITQVPKISDSDRRPAVSVNTHPRRVLNRMPDCHDGTLALAGHHIAHAVVPVVQTFRGVMVTHHDEIDVVQLGKSRNFITGYSMHEMVFESDSVHSRRRRTGASYVGRLRRGSSREFTKGKPQ